MKRPVLTISLLAALAVTMVVPLNSVAKLHYKSCRNGKCPPKPVEVFDEDQQLLITALSHQPELMNVEYLKYFIGRPENEHEQTGSLNKRYYWYDTQTHQLDYELEQTERAPGQVVESTFIVNLSGCGLDFEKLQPLYGKMSRRFFDYSGHPSQLFTFAPKTFLSFSSPPNSFRLNQAKIYYRGGVLPAPPAEAMQAAEANLIARSATADQSEASEQLIPVLQARVKTRPFDAEAHLMLAQAFAKHSHMHEAIGEYKVALAMSGSNDQVRNQSLEALRSLHIIADPNQESARRNLEIVQHGQRIRVQGEEKKSHKKDGQDSDAS